MFLYFLYWISLGVIPNPGKYTKMLPLHGARIYHWEPDIVLYQVFFHNVFYKTKCILSLLTNQNHLYTYPITADNSNGMFFFNQDYISLFPHIKVENHPYILLQAEFQSPHFLSRIEQWQHVTFSINWLTVDQISVLVFVPNINFPTTFIHISYGLPTWTS